MSIPDKVKDFIAEKPGKLICICGESGVGKSTLVKQIASKNTIVLDGDSIRWYINQDLGYSDKDRAENNRRISNIARMLILQGHDVIISTVRADLAYENLKDLDCFKRLITITF